MTGSLHHQFAQVRDTLDDVAMAKAVAGHSATAEYAALAALSVIERHLEDMETALRRLEPYASRAEMRWMSVEDATIEIPARLVAEITRLAALSVGEERSEA